MPLSYGVTPFDYTPPAHWNVRRSRSYPALGNRVLSVREAERQAKARAAFLFSRYPQLESVLVQVWEECATCDGSGEQIVFVVGSSTRMMRCKGCRGTGVDILSPIYNAIHDREGNQLGRPPTNEVRP